MRQRHGGRRDGSAPARSTGRRSLGGWVRAAGGLLAAGLAGSLALSGCGVSAQSLRPSVAAEVDGSTISIAKVDDLTKSFCTVIRAKSPQPISGAAARQAILQGLVLRTVADRLDASGHYGVSSSSAYDQDRQMAAASLTTPQLSTSRRDALLSAYVGGQYFVDLVTQIGRQKLGLTSQQDLQGQGANAGFAIAQAFLRAHPITVNPVFQPIDISAPNSSTERSDTSVAVSSFAKAAIDAQVEVTPGADATAYVESLPASQRCG